MTTPSNQPLARGYQLQNYTIAKLLSAGGFSIVYLAHDENDYPVAIKEYLPNSLVLRREGTQVQATSEENLALFRHGLKCFFEEGKTLAHISHPNIVRVRNFFRGNDTVYMVMEYERGRTLQKKKSSSSMTAKALTKKTDPARVLSPVKWPARSPFKQAAASGYQARQYLYPQRRLTGIAGLWLGTPGINGRTFQAGPDVYAGLCRARAIRQKKEPLGPWTDIYGVGATMYACLAGTAPPAADQRLKEDKLVNLTERYGDRYSPELLNLIDRCLKMDQDLRPQSVHQVQKQLLQPGSPPARKRTLINQLRRTWQTLTTKPARVSE